MSFEFKFCPNCGAARFGRFCGGCGLDFLNLGLPTPIPEVAPVEDLRPGPSLPELPIGMVYGDSFEPEGDCPNCGSPTDDGACDLCGPDE
jgi:hypothetical protein